MDNFKLGDTEEMKRQEKANALSLIFADIKNIEALEGQSIKEVFSSENNIRNLIKKISEKQLIGLLNALNGIIRGANPSEWGMTDKHMEITGAWVEN